MNNTLKGLVAEQLGDALSVSKIQLDKGELLMWLKKFETGKFQVNVIIVIQVVDADNLVTGGQQALRYVEANKSCCAGYQIFHTALVSYAIWIEAPRPIA